MGRSSRGCFDGSDDLKKGPWSPEEDQKLITYIQNHGHGNWRPLPKLAGINRCGKSCRLRWMNYLRPDIKRGKITREEEQCILNLHSVLGNKWSAIARHLPGRTDNEIKNFWNTHLKKKLIHMGFDPMTHRPRTGGVFSSLAHIIGLATLKQLMENPLWEEYELRLHAETLQYLLQPPSLTNINNNNNPTEIEIMNLINPLSAPLFENQMVTQNNNNNNSLPPVATESVGALFSHLPSLAEMIPNNTNTTYETALLVGKNNEVGDPNIFHDGPFANTNCGDSCSSSSFVGSSSSIWSDHLLFEDPLFHDTPPPPPNWLN